MSFKKPILRCIGAHHRQNFVLNHVKPRVGHFSLPSRTWNFICFFLKKKADFEWKIAIHRFCHALACVFVRYGDAPSLSRNRRPGNFTRSAHCLWLVQDLSRYCKIEVAGEVLHTPTFKRACFRWGIGKRTAILLDFLRWSSGRNLVYASSL